MEHDFCGQNIEADEQIKKSGEKKLSLEPDSNQWPMDACMISYYSPPLYQLSYRGIVVGSIEFTKILKNLK